MSKIDDLYNRAFSGRSFTYEDDSWEKMNSILDEKMPVSEASSSAISNLSGWLTLVVFSALSILNSSVEELSFVKEEPIYAQVNESVSPEEPKSIESTVVELKQRVEVEPILEPSNAILPEKKLELAQIELSSSSMKVVKSSTKFNYNASKSNVQEQGREDLSVNATPVVFTSIAENVENEQFNKEVIQSTVQKSIVVYDEPKPVRPSDINLMALTYPEEYAGFKLQPVKNNKRKLQLPAVGARLFLGATYGYDELRDMSNLNIDVNEDIKNVALVNTTNEFRSMGIDLGIKWKGLVASSGIHLSQHSKAYSIYYSHTRNWTETSVENHTALESVDSTQTGATTRTVWRNGRWEFENVAVWQVDSTIRSWSDTTQTDYESTRELNEQFQFDIKYASIPVQVGYEFQVKRVLLGVYAGMQFNILTKGEGRIYDPYSDEVVAFNMEDQLNPVVYRANLGFGLGYELSPNWTIMAQPRIVTSLNETFKTNDHYNTTTTGYGANLFLRYSF